MAPNNSSSSSVAIAAKRLDTLLQENNREEIPHAPYCAVMKTLRNCEFWSYFCEGLVGYFEAKCLLVIVTSLFSRRLIKAVRHFCSLTNTKSNFI